MRLVCLLLAAVVCRAASPGPSTSDINSIYPGIEALYINIHSNPELGFEEKQTAVKLAGRLKALDIVDFRPPELDLHVVHDRGRAPGKAGRWLIEDIRRRLPSCIEPMTLPKIAETA